MLSILKDGSFLVKIVEAAGFKWEGLGKVASQCSSCWNNPFWKGTEWYVYILH